MGRRKSRKNRDDDDDYLERSYLAKRAKVTVEDAREPVQGLGNETRETQKAVVSTTVVDPTADAAAKIERLRMKKQRKKEQKKQKDMERKAAQEKLRDAATSNASRPVETKKTKPSRSDTIVSCRKGVKYQDVIVGKGPFLQDRKKIHVKYVLRMKNPTTGKILDSSDNFGFRVGRGEVIEGWDIGLEGMRQGGTRDLVVPPEAGYGRKNIGAGVGGILYFRVTLLKC